MTQHDLRQIITPRDLNAQRELRPAPPTRALGKLAQLLLGQGAESQELPPIAELVSAAIALATGKRRKALIPLTSSTGELALVRRGTDVLISYYDTGHVPQVLVRNRPIEVKTLLDACPNHPCLSK